MELHALLVTSSLLTGLCPKLHVLKLIFHVYNCLWIVFPGSDAQVWRLIWWERCLVKLESSISLNSFPDNVSIFWQISLFVWLMYFTISQVLWQSAWCVVCFRFIPQSVSEKERHSAWFEWEMQTNWLSNGCEKDFIEPQFRQTNFWASVKRRKPGMMGKAGAISLVRETKNVRCCSFALCPTSRDPKTSRQTCWGQGCLPQTENVTRNTCYGITHR